MRKEEKLKRFVLLVTIQLLALSASAQKSPIDEGSMIVEGSAYFATQSGKAYQDAEGNGISTISVSPQLGYFVSPSLMIGGHLDYSSTSQGDLSGSGFGFGPTIGYFFYLDRGKTEIKGSIYPYIVGMFAYASSRTEVGHTTYKSNSTSFGAKSGIMCMLSEAVALDLGLKFVSSSQEPIGGGESVSGTTFMISTGVTAFLWK